jgi:hypothetical protein
LARALFEVTSGGVFWMVAVGPARWAMRVFVLSFIAFVFRYLKVIRSVRLRVEALTFKGSFSAFELF